MNSKLLVGFAAWIIALATAPEIASAHGPSVQQPGYWTIPSINFDFAPSVPIGFQSSVINAAVQWNNLDANVKLAYASGVNAPDNASYQYCPHPANKSSIQYQSVQFAPAVNYLCPIGPSPIASFATAFSPGQTWYVGVGTPPPNSLDLWGVATHEFGHALSLDHFDNLDPIACQLYNSVRSTMCTGGSTLGDFERTLQLHAHTLRSRYPTANWAATRQYVRHSLTTGSPDMTFDFGNGEDRPLSCDWDGDGTDTLGLLRGNTWYLAGSNTNGGGSVTTFGYGNAGDIPICGDWNGDGIDTIGVKRGANYYLRNSNSAGVSDIQLLFGGQQGTPVVGDWDGLAGIDLSCPNLATCDHVGVYANGQFLLDTNNANGFEIQVTFGNSTGGDYPVVGDWNHDLRTTVGVIEGGTHWILTNANISLPPIDHDFTFGLLGDWPIPGNYDGAGGDSAAVRRAA